MYDAATDEMVLFNLSVQSPKSGAPPGWRRDATSPIRANPDGGVNAGWAPAAMARKESGPSLMAAPDYGSRAPSERQRGTADAAFHERTLRLINAEKMRGVNDSNRRRFGQPPIAGKERCYRYRLGC